MAFLAILFLLQVFPSLLLAAGLAVQPATFLFQDVSIGEKIRLSVPLSVHNKDSESHTYVIAPFLPSSIGMAWPDGYTEIPDTTWFAFEKREITVAGGGIGSTVMYIEIPGVDAYYNQKWVIGLGVTTKVESGESISLAVYPRFLIETESREEIKGRPAGKTGVRPGRLTISPESDRESGI
ncbi:MAG: hypothetical protein HZB32_01400, partial [Nitrospirae bacterium]|nr:hypothetical protein [Nitrospirota bacterium]